MDNAGIIAREEFKPSLCEKYLDEFNLLIEVLRNTFHGDRLHVLNARIQGLNNLLKQDENNLEGYKYLTTLLILSDLVKQGWSIEIENDKLMLVLQLEKMSDKDRIRYRLKPERDAQFNTKSAKEFINRLEKEKLFNNNRISIKVLFGDAQALLEKINQPELLIAGRLIDPYIQLVEHKHDEQTGYWLSDIWRYFRFTWSIPYKTMPGRNLFYLVRDRAQPYHPVIGIFALGNTVLNLTVRDNAIGWTVGAIRKQLKRKTQTDLYEQQVAKTNGSMIKVSNNVYLETEDEHKIRIQAFSRQTINMLLHNIQNAINEIYVNDLENVNIENPTIEMIADLREISEELRKILIDNPKGKGWDNFEDAAKEYFFKNKRTQELANLLSSRLFIEQNRNEDYAIWLEALMKNDASRTAVHTALIANRKNKIGSNMMEIIVCGAIPPYNELLGGKLVSMLACSPRVIKDYTDKYSKQVSEIASRMAGRKIVRDSRLVFLGTTSLYSIGSSQYNRIKMTEEDGGGIAISYNKMGITEGYGSVYFSKETTASMQKIAELMDGGRKINNIFGEGTSPRFRMICKGLAAINLKSEVFLRHHSPRIVFSIELARNTRDFLLGLTDEVNYGFDIGSNEDVAQKTNGIIDYWQKRWLKKRLANEELDITERLNAFNAEQHLLSRIQ